jgi:hypothetical protein
MKKYWNISVTHVALGTIRVMRTTGMMSDVRRAFQPVIRNRMETTCLAALTTNGFR